MKDNIFTKIHAIRLGLLLGAVAIILLLLPREDHQSYSYELNQPWKYQLLTADFDTPILRDSMSARKMRDSIDANFIPFVKRDASVVKQNMTRFRTIVREQMPGTDLRSIDALLAEVYNRGVVDSKVYDQMARQAQPKLRVAGMEAGAASVTTVDASGVLSPSKAFEYIDSAYSRPHSGSAPHQLDARVAKALNISIVPNLVNDTAADYKYRSQEYLAVNAALGVIKSGQRIVDKGEIVTPQVFTNLNTYLEMKEKNHSGTTSHTYFYIGQSLYITICFLGLYMFLAIFRSIFYNDPKKMTFTMIFLTLFVTFAILMFEYFADGIYFVPFAAVSVIMMIFFDSRTSIFSLLCVVMISAIVAVYPLQYIFLELMAGLTAAFSIKQLSQRSQLLRTAFLTFLAYVLGYFVFRLLSDGDLSMFRWRIVGIFAVNSVILSFAYILILIIEKLFGFTSTVTLVELSDINNPLLRRLAEEAPGTFQHSMQVSMLAAEAARAIGANTQLVRTGALYHDIGKLESPIFFTENQHGVNPHNGLDPETSAQKIISHVTAGLALASKNKLPDVIRSFIAEHHGKNLTRYFYNTAVNQSSDGIVDKSKFTYPGPNPQSRETAVLMMADAVEAASRSLTDYSKESINALVDRIIDNQESEGLFRESPISFRDIETIKSTFKKRLATIYHSRIVYPEIHRHAEENGGEANKTADSGVVK